MTCKKCGRGPHEIGGYLTRVNEKGVPGIFECAPNCEADLPSDVAVLLAIEGEPK
jgi:hypothetical protein